MTLRPQAFTRNANAGPLLDTFLVCSIGSVLATRAYLAATGYPQVGNGTFHIAHVLWGGLLMLVAIVIALAAINTQAKRALAILGGIGFGLFIDEVGKFITKNVDYFFKPAIAIIYVCFIALFFVFRSISRDSKLSPETALANALSILADHPEQPLTTSDRVRAEYLLSRAPDLPLTPAVTDLVAAMPTTPAKPSRIEAFLQRALLAPLQTIAASRIFIWVMAIYAAVAVVTVLALAVEVFLLIPNATRRDAWRTLESGPGTGVAAACIIIGTIIFGVMMGIGLLHLRRSRLRALVWFDRAFLFSILVIQVFLFAESQLAAIGGLVIDLLFWGAIRIALTHEREHVESDQLHHPGIEASALPH